MKHISLFLLFTLLFISNAYSQKTEDYIITSVGDTIKGKVIYAPGNKIQFKAAGQKKVAEYFPLEINGYWYKGTYKISKYSKTDNKAVFFHHYRANEDSIAFEKATGMTVPQQGKIVLYYVHPYSSPGAMTPTGTMMGGGGRSASIIYEITGTDEVYFSDIYTARTLLWDKSIAIKTLAEIVKDNQQLVERVYKMEGKFNLEFVSQIVKEYNDWYTLQPAKP